MASHPYPFRLLLCIQVTRHSFMSVQYVASDKDLYVIGTKIDIMQYGDKCDYSDDRFINIAAVEDTNTKSSFKSYRSNW